MSLHSVSLQRSRTGLVTAIASLCTPVSPFVYLGTRTLASAKLCDVPFRQCYEYSDLRPQRLRQLRMWLLPVLILFGYSLSARASRIDTHHHIMPPEYVAYCKHEGTSSIIS